MSDTLPDTREVHDARDTQGETHGTSGRLERRIGLWSAIAILVGSTIGSGIFRSPAGIADRLPGPLPLLSVWVVGGLLALCGALTLAEVAGAFPATGGVYVFIREGWGRLPAFLFGWAELVVIRAAALGAVSTTFAEYFLRALGHDPRAAPYDAWVHYIAASAIILTGAFNYVGVRWGTLVQNVLTLLKCGGLLGVVLLAFALAIPGSGDHFVPAAPPGSFGAARFGLALVSVLWVYDGWADLSFVAGEVKDPRRNLPRALIGGTLAVITIYLLANVAYLTVLPIAEMRRSTLVAADVAQRLVGPVGVTLVGATVMISSFGTLNGSMLTGPRVLWAMANDRVLFSGLAAIHPRFGTPYRTIALATALGVTFVMLRSFEQLADAFVTAILPFYALAVAAVFPLRRGAAYNPPFRVPGYPVVPLLFVAATAYLLLNGVADPGARWPTLAVFALIAAGVPVYRRFL